jgi:hypothetical protein
MNFNKSIKNFFSRNKPPAETGMGHSVPQRGASGAILSPAGFGEIPRRGTQITPRQMSFISIKHSTGALVKRASSNLSATALREKISDITWSRGTTPNSQTDHTVQAGHNSIHQSAAQVFDTSPESGVIQFTSIPPEGVKRPIPVVPFVDLGKMKAVNNSTTENVTPSSKLSPPRSDAALPSAASPNPAVALDNSQTHQ